jgi:hypothetical protein
MPVTIKLSNPTASEIEAAICRLNDTLRDEFEKPIDGSDKIPQGAYVMAWNGVRERFTLCKFVCELTNEPGPCFVAETADTGNLYKWENCCLLETFPAVVACK